MLWKKTIPWEAADGVLSGYLDHVAFDAKVDEAECQEAADGDIIVFTAIADSGRIHPVSHERYRMRDVTVNEERGVKYARLEPIGRAMDCN